MKKSKPKNKKILQVKIEHYKWIEGRVADYRASVLVDGKLAEGVDGLKSNHLVCILRSDFQHDYPLLSKKEINETMFTVLGDLVRKSELQVVKK